MISGIVMEHTAEKERHDRVMAMSDVCAPQGQAAPASLEGNPREL